MPLLPPRVHVHGLWHLLLACVRSAESVLAFRFPMSVFVSWNLTCTVIWLRELLFRINSLLLYSDVCWFPADCFHRGTSQCGRKLYRRGHLVFPVMVEWQAWRGKQEFPRNAPSAAPRLGRCGWRMGSNEEERDTGSIRKRCDDVWKASEFTVANEGDSIWLAERG